MARHFSSLADPELIDIIKNGGVGVIPTDTVYGLVALASQEPAVQKLYHTKRRELPPGTMIGADTESFVKLGFDHAQLDRVAHYWPAPLSVLLDATAAPAYLKQSREALPVRIPDDANLTTLLAATGPLMTTSANAPKQPTSTTIQMAVDYFGDDIDFYVDGGDLSGRPPSTIIGFDDSDKIVVHRHGAVTIDQ